MIKVKRRGVMNKNFIKSIFKKYNFNIINNIYINNGMLFIVEKNYSSNFNIKFDGLIKLEVKVDFRLNNYLCAFYYPTFREISNLIPKKCENHIYDNGNICYAPPQRPIDEAWEIEDFIVAVDAMINNYFCIEYIGTSTLFELEHGSIGMRQYKYINYYK